MLIKNIIKKRNYTYKIKIKSKHTNVYCPYFEYEKIYHEFVNNF